MRMDIAELVLRTWAYFLCLLIDWSVQDFWVQAELTFHVFDLSRFEEGFHYVEEGNELAEDLLQMSGKLRQMCWIAYNCLALRIFSSNILEDAHHLSYLSRHAERRELFVVGFASVPTCMFKIRFTDTPNETYRSHVLWLSVST